MTLIALRSEEFSPEGSVSGLAIRRNMGRSSLDSASLLLREAVQNAWDARVDRDAGHVSFQIHLQTLTTRQAEVLDRIIFRQKPAEHPLAGALVKGMGMMVLRDSGTLGLNGPVFHVARKGADEDRARNFIRFVRDIGRGASKQRGGGTYGFGKSTFFTGSSLGTIIVYTRCLDPDGTVEDRLIALSLWTPSDDETLTGRHWWGVRTTKGIVPLTGEAAVSMAESVGIPRFKKKETGTAIAVLSPSLVTPYTKPDHEAARALAESLTTWFWPRMTAAPDGKPWMAFEVFYEGRSVAVPQPEDVEPFKTMAAQLATLVAGEKIPDGGECHAIASEKPKAVLGALCVSPLSSAPEPAAWKSLAIEGHVLGELMDPAGGGPRCHHIALMRAPWQVVRYLPCRSLRSHGSGLAGVFLVDGAPEMDDAFADSEPPAHDDWVPDGLSDEWRRRYVRIALRKIRETGDRMAESIDGRASAGRGPDLARLSVFLGGLLPEAATSRTVEQADGQRTAVKKTSQPINLVDQGSISMLHGSRIFAATFRLGAAPSSGERIEVSGNPRILVLGGRAEDDSDQSRRPEIIGWREGPDRPVRPGPTLVIAESDPIQWQVLVSLPIEAQIGVSLTARRTER